MNNYRFGNDESLFEASNPHYVGSVFAGKTCMFCNGTGLVGSNNLSSIGSSVSVDSSRVLTKSCSPLFGLLANNQPAYATAGLDCSNEGINYLGLLCNNRNKNTIGCCDRFGGVTSSLSNLLGDNPQFSGAEVGCYSPRAVEIGGNALNKVLPFGSSSSHGVTSIYSGNHENDVGVGARALASAICQNNDGCFGLGANLIGCVKSTLVGPPNNNLLSGGSVTASSLLEYIGNSNYNSSSQENNSALAGASVLEGEYLEKRENSRLDSVIEKAVSVAIARKDQKKDKKIDQIYSLLCFFVPMLISAFPFKNEDQCVSEAENVMAPTIRANCVKAGLKSGQESREESERNWKDVIEKASEISRENPGQYSAIALARLMFPMVQRREIVVYGQEYDNNERAFIRTARKKFGAHEDICAFLKRKGVGKNK
ncbi:MAG: hypothetical protein KAS93_02845 [Gammaproteobacteria bacterium]|nr:hypothetical protein [Gammaproteobacteria bacterium]